jgi:ribosomal protein S4
MHHNEYLPNLKKKKKKILFMSVQSLFLHWYREVTFILCICPPCRRRLSTVLVRLKFCEHLKEAVTYIEQGHIRVGPETVTDPAFLVTRNMEDFVTWVDSSKIKRKVLQYNDQLDDYDAMT